MAVTRSRAAERTRPKAVHRAVRQQAWRTTELLGILVAALLVAAGLIQVYRSRTPLLTETEQGLAGKRLLNLNALGAREELLPVLALIPDTRARQEVARRIYYVSGGLSNVGGIRQFLTGDQFRELKPQFVVRQPQQFRSAFWLWSGIFLAAFLLVHAWWSVRGFAGDQVFLPAILALSGIGLVIMVSLRDPVRDNMLFVDFAQGVAAGAILLAAASALDYERLFGRLSYVPLLGAFVLSAALLVFGHGPGTSGAKVNLFGFQPVEIIRLLLVFFLAGYFARRWDVLRHAREKRESLARITRRIDIPPVEYTLPVLVSVILSLAFFFLQRDMGPALVFACLFLVLYGIARGSTFVPAAGLALMVAGFGVGYLLGVPHTVWERVAMWASPWNNLAHGGDQLAHSLWAFATGGIAGMGVGYGDAQLVPAAHTDLVLSAIGEELGFLGVAAVFALFALIVYKALRIAARARTDYEFFLGAGLAAVTALQTLIIAGGALGLLPLSGVVTPFLSYGRTSMLANFLVVGILMALSARQALRSGRAPAADVEPRPSGSGLSVKWPGLIFAFFGAAVLAKAAYVQVLRSAPVMGEGTLVVQADGMRRYQYNPRFQEVMRQIPKGTVYDRNGLPLATSNRAELEEHRAAYQQLGIDIDRACPRSDSRYYPFGGLMFDLLGDLRTRMRWGASNTSFVERDSARRLRGYDDRPELVEIENPRTGKLERTIRYDYRELVPLLRHRYEPDHPAVRRVLDRPRDVRMTIDARLQTRVGEILRAQLKQAGQDKGAAVVIDPATGDLLAAVSFPLPPAATTEQPAEGNPYLDRARYGLYPPGSTFKVVTAMAALRRDPGLTGRTFECVRLPDGRVGNFLKGSSRPIRDDIQDHTPHGTVNMQRGIVVSCNAYFAQLGTYEVGAQALFDTATALGIASASPDSAAELKKSLAQSAYGQGEVVASPFQMARVAATVANGGMMPQGRWLADENNPRNNPPRQVLAPDAAQTLSRFMREVVTSGTGRRAATGIALAGKTGTAELENAPSHAWFIGFAPYGSGARKIAFSVLVENGVYGGTSAAPASAEIVNAAAKLGLIQP
jgi:cell division protein FtsW (lipid II flippase)